MFLKWSQLAFRYNILGPAALDGLIEHLRCARPKGCARHDLHRSPALLTEPFDLGCEAQAQWPLRVEPSPGKSNVRRAKPAHCFGSVLRGNRDLLHIAVNGLLSRDVKS